MGMQGREYQEAFVQNLMMQLGLVKAADTVIGDDKVPCVHASRCHDSVRMYHAASASPTAQCRLLKGFYDILYA